MKAGDLKDETGSREITVKDLRELTPDKCPECGSGLIEVDCSWDRMFRAKFEGEKLVLISEQSYESTVPAVFCWLCEKCGKEGAYGPVLYLGKSDISV